MASLLDWLGDLFRGPSDRRLSETERKRESMASSQDTLEAALELIREHEGGYVDHPRDPGGCTNMGITLSTYRRHTHSQATCDDLRKMEWETAKEIYRSSYWDVCGCGELPPPIALSVFDFAVNVGPGRAVRLLQELLGVIQDGIIGPVTIKAAWRTEQKRLVRRYRNRRIDYYRSLGTFDVFGRGWLARADKTAQRSLEYT